MGQIGVCPPSIVTELSSFGSPLSSELAESIVKEFDLTYFGNHMGATEIAWFLTRDVRGDPAGASSPGTAAANVSVRVVSLNEDGTAGDPEDSCEPGETGEIILSAESS